MLTISRLAHLTGVTPRMLRHWESEGLLTPAAIDVATGYRRYAVSQAGRVHAIAALRSLGFGLDQIGDLLDPALSIPRLRDVLVDRERELTDRIRSDRAALDQVRARLRSIEEGLLMTTHELQLHALPALRLAALTQAVGDETEIGHTVVDLEARVREAVATGGRHWDGTVVRTYTAPPSGAITVAVGVEVPDGVPPAGLDLTEVPGEPDGVSVIYDGALTSEADAWLALDTALGPRGLATTSVYRLLVRPDSVTLQAPVVTASDC